MRQIILLLLLTSLVAFCGGEKTGPAKQEKMPKITRVLTDGLKIRISPNTMGAIVGQLDYGESVKLLDKSTDPMRVGQMSSHWYKVETVNGLTGWVYGAYLEAEANPDVLAASQTNEEVRKRLNGKWLATYKSGRLTSYFVSIYDDNRFEFGRSDSVLQKGELEIDGHGKKAELSTGELEKPLFTNMKAELRNDTLIFRGTFNNDEVTFTFAEDTK